jgi:chorismate mutase / prephenate dehydratase
VTYYRPEREAKILREIRKRNQGPLDSAIVTQIFRTLMSACLALQQQIKVAYLGPPGTFSEAAAIKHFGSSVDLVAVDTLEQVLYQVEGDYAHYAVIPIENSTTGVVVGGLNALMHSSLKICGEIILPIHHHLWRTSTAKKPIQRIYAHQQSLAQCQKWLALHQAQTEKVPVSSNGLAAQLAQEEEDAAAIAGDSAGILYGLQKIASHLEDEPQNQTRFLIMGKNSTLPSGKDKTTLLIKTPHTPGTLLKLLKPFAEHQINITWLESRPCPQQSWSYLFFLDIEGHQEDEEVKKALQTLAAQSVILTILGSYPRFLEKL